MGWYKTVTYRKTRVCANNTTELGRANQIDMTGPNSVVLFAQTLVCSLCNYYKDRNTNRQDRNIDKHEDR